MTVCTNGTIPLLSTFSLLRLHACQLLALKPYNIRHAPGSADMTDLMLKFSKEPACELQTSF